MSAQMIREIASNNSSYATTHIPPPTFAAFPNTKATMIISCMDPRADPTVFWNLPASSGVPVIRCAGGRVTDDTLRSIRVLSAIMGNGRNTVGAVAVVHHTDCGMVNFSNERIAELLVEHAGLDEGRAGVVRGMDFGSFHGCASIEESVWEDIRRIKEDPYLPKEIEVVGYVYDVFSGKTTEVGVL